MMDGMSAESPRPPQAFVLMPFLPGLTPIFEELIRPAFEDAGYEVARADTHLTQQNILRDVIAGIAKADVVVADLTTLNPNVMYELGIAHGLQIPTILITQSLEDLPFDLRSYRVIEYSEQFAEAPKLLESLRELASRRLQGTSAFGSPVLDFLGSREIAPRELPPVASSPASPEPPPESQPDPEVPKGFLDFAVATQDESERMTALLNEINGATTTLGARLVQRTAELGRAPDNLRLALAISIHAARDMTEFADQVDAILPEYSDLTNQLEEDLSNFVTQSNIASEEDRQSAESFRDTMADQGPTIREALGSIAEFRKTADELPPVSQAMNAAKRRVVAALDKTMSALEKHEALTARVVDLLDAKLRRVEKDDDPN
jgi:hypothetical protein